MELKRITGPDMRTALRLVREQLGPDAIILSNRRTAAGVEIVAGPEQEWPDAVPVPEAVPPASAAPVAPVAAMPVQPAARAPLEDAPTPVEPAAGTVQSELRDLRALLEQSLGEMQLERLAWAPGIEGRAWRDLSRRGLPNDLVHALVRDMDGQAEWELAWVALKDRLAAGLVEAGDPVAAGGAFALVGPTGAGKTTTLCKLAVRHVLEHGSEGLVLASLDATRIGGSDMLRALARLLDVPFHAGEDDETPEQLLERIGPCRLLLIDTAGWNRRHAQQAYQLAALGRMGPRVRSLLVLPANAQLAWLNAALRDHRHAAPAAAVITRLDETVSLGEVLGALHTAALPIAYVSDGQEIPDDLHVASVRALVEQALEPDAATPDAGQPARRARHTVAGANAARIA